MRGEDDAELVLGDRLHQVLQELPPGERVERRDRLVEDQQLRALGDAQLAAGELARLLREVEAEPLDPAWRVDDLGLEDIVLAYLSQNATESETSLEVVR